MSPSDLTQFVLLFTLADPAATERLTARLALVLRDPAAYQAQYADEVAERGIEAALPVQEVRDVALIDALLSEDLLYEADWKESAGSMAEVLNEILQQQGRTQRLDPSGLERHSGRGPEALDAVQDALEAQGLALVLFTLDSDSYPLGVVADEQAAALAELARQLGFSVAVY